MSTLTSQENSKIIETNISIVKTDFYHIRDSLDMMEWLTEKNDTDRLSSYLPDLKRAVKELKKHIRLLNRSVEA